MSTPFSVDPASVGLTSANIDTSRTAVEAVSDYAQASISLVPKLDDMPIWYAPIQTAVSAAQSQSKTWLDTICPAVTTGLPVEIIRFNKTFETESAKILKVLDDAGAGAPTAAQKQAVSDALKCILADTQKFADQAANVRAQIATYTKQLMADVDALGGAISTLEEHLTDGRQYVQKLKQIYASNFINIENRISPCNVIVMLDMNISIKVTETSAPTQAIAIVMAQTLVGAVDHNVKQTMPPLQVVMDSWGTLQAKINAILSDLDSVSTDFAGFLKQFDFQAAQEQWGELSDYATELVP
ncbi:MAG: hypothetical protein ACSHWS_16020 [Sulfitobacter sp.]